MPCASIHALHLFTRRPARRGAAVVEDEEMGQVLQFQGDQRDAVAKFLTENGAARMHL